MSTSIDLIVVLQYWNDDELMMKINAKMRAMQLEKQGAKDKPVIEPSNLFDAAKAGDVTAAEKMIAEGADINGKVYNQKSVEL
jgi:hypothetical protein